MAYINPSDALTIKLQPVETQPPYTTGSYRSFRRGRVTLPVSADAMRCRYPSKPCPHVRVAKASGALHRYCAYHRNKANVNQKRWVDRQRGEQSASPTSSPTSSVSSVSSQHSSWSPTYATTKYRWIMAAGQSKQPTSPTSIHESVAVEKRESAVIVETRGDEDSTPTGVENLSEEDWGSLLSLLASDSASTSDPETVNV